MQDEYRTNDLKEAAYLAFYGLPFEFDRRIPNKVVIIFRGGEGFLEFITQRVRSFNEGPDMRFKKLLISFIEMKRAIIGKDNYVPGYHQRSVDSVIPPQ